MWLTWKSYDHHDSEGAGAVEERCHWADLQIKSELRKVTASRLHVLYVHLCPDCPRIGRQHSRMLLGGVKSESCVARVTVMSCLDLDRDWSRNFRALQGGKKSSIFTTWATKGLS